MLLIDRVYDCETALDPLCDQLIEHLERKFHSVTDSSRVCIRCPLRISSGMLEHWRRETHWYQAAESRISVAIQLLVVYTDVSHPKILGFW